MSWNKSSAKYQSLKEEIDNVISLIAKVMTGSPEEKMRNVEQAKPQTQIDKVINQIKGSEGQGEITSREAEELRSHLQEGLKKHGVNITFHH